MTGDHRKWVKVVRTAGDDRGADPEPPYDGTGRSAAERIGMMWRLARDTWAFKGEAERAESRLQRHAVRVRRGGR